MTVAHAHVERLNKQLTASVESLPVQFNPSEFTLNKGLQLADVAIPGLDAPVIQFVRGNNETLSVDLFFDTTEDGSAVTTKTDAFYRLIKIDPELHVPPICRFVWGEGDFPGAHLPGEAGSQRRTNGFQCIVESVRQRFTLFDSTGTPLRATLTVTLREYKTLEQQLREIRFRSPDHTRTHVLQRGETLAQIAFDAYDDAAQWRTIAEHNGVLDPLALTPGTVLELPPTR